MKRSAIFAFGFVLATFGLSADAAHAAAPAWIAAPEMPLARSAYVATRLGDGRVLMAGGGYASAAYTRTAVAYQPSTGTWASVADLSIERVAATATTLDDGSALIVGGGHFEVCNPPFQCFIGSGGTRFDPATNSWEDTGAMQQPRFVHVATRLADGRVLVAGGEQHALGKLKLAEIYDPGLDSWTGIAPMNEIRAYFSGVTMLDGRVLVAGWAGATTEIYDPLTNTWSYTGNIHSSTLTGAIMAPLPDGRVLLAGGYNGSDSVTRTEVYDPSTGVWSIVDDMTFPRHNFAATTLQDGRILVVGGQSDTTSLTYLSSAEIFDPATNLWTTTASLAAPRAVPRAITLADGSVLLAGGIDNAGNLAVAEIYEVADDYDGDGRLDGVDNCPATPNPAQADFDADSRGDACDSNDDNDGCSDAEEGGGAPQLGGMRNPMFPHDFYDVNGSRKVDGLDVNQVRMKFNTATGHPSYAVTHDRSTGAAAWAPGAPNGVINGFDINLVRSSFNHDCTAGP
jgi:N-acetylneuraminic acid mutarotase